MDGGSLSSVGEDSVLVYERILAYMVQRANAAEAQGRRDLCAFILGGNGLKTIYLSDSHDSSHAG